jgi:geranylgeranyl diphosphate synthase type I
MDEDSERRGMLSMHKYFDELFLKDYGEIKYEGQIFRKMSGRFGVSLAILQGDILYALTEKCFTHSPFGPDKIRKALDVINHTYRVICEGQMLDILSELKRDITENDYLGVIESKTAHLFRAAVQVGAIFGSATARPLNALSQYAISIGTAFQLQDDLMDISPGLKGHAFGSDIRRGKYTLLMIKAFEMASQKQRQILLSALGNDKADRGTLNAAVEALYASGAVDYVKGLARQKLREGKACLINAGLSEEARAFFEGLANFMA